MGWGRESEEAGQAVEMKHRRPMRVLRTCIHTTRQCAISASLYEYTAPSRALLCRQTDGGRESGFAGQLARCVGSMGVVPHQRTGFGMGVIEGRVLLWAGRLRRARRFRATGSTRHNGLASWMPWHSVPGSRSVSCRDGNFPQPRNKRHGMGHGPLEDRFSAGC